MSEQESEILATKDKITPEADSYVVSEANKDRLSRDSPTSEKHLFLVFLRKDLRDVSAVEFIRHTIQCNSFPPWEDATEDLKSNIIEATPKQAEKIKSHRDIVRITPIEATSLEDDLEPEEYSPKTPYVVRATNRRDKDACHVTHASLKDIFQDQLQPQELGTHGVGLWKVNSTSDQVPLAAKIQGVRSIVPLDQYLLKEAETSATRKRRMIRPIAIHYQELQIHRQCSQGPLWGQCGTSITSRWRDISLDGNVIF
ncbi:uncharacterized protein FFMR_06867 [Fusarium fujikuroi]|nr:uncharacterized protein FFMR_06867 [Fusarium fujikuroi]